VAIAARYKGYRQQGPSDLGICRGAPHGGAAPRLIPQRHHGATPFPDGKAVDGSPTDSFSRRSADRSGRW
jgi:hypothetical protein